MSRALTRREWLGVAGLGAAGLTLGGCAARLSRVATPPYRRPLSMRAFERPRVDPDLVVREVVGLRPYRPSGFVVRADRMDGKLVVHNYGHGGGGITLSWGSSALAVREAGGKATTLDGREIGHTSTTVLAAAEEALHAELAGLVGRVRSNG